jgi:hypothetical protein
MAKGGHREGAGRPVGRKDSGVRHKKTSLPMSKTGLNVQLPAKTTYMQLEKYLSAANRKVYRSLATKFESPSECLKAIRDDLVARYNLGRIGEIEAVSHIRKRAKDGIKEITETGKLNGKELTDVQKADELSKLTEQLKAYPQISSKITSLAGEIRQINELIDRIESGRPDKVINLFNILDGRADKSKTERLRDEIFTLPEETKENVDQNNDNVEDGEIVPNEEEEEQICNDTAEAHVKEQEALEEPIEEEEKEENMDDTFDDPFAGNTK